MPYVLVKRPFNATLGGRSRGLGLVDRRFGQLRDRSTTAAASKFGAPPEVSSRLPSSPSISEISDGGLSAVPFSVGGAPIREWSPKASVIVRTA